MSKLKVGTIHTLYGRRGGAEMLAEKLICGMVENFEDLAFIVYCNDEAFHALPDDISRLEKCLVPALNNQYTKAIWLEAVAARVVHREGLDLFWIPSGTNSFPGRWTIPTVVTFLDLGEYFVKGKYDFKRTFYRKRICIPKSLSRGTLFTSISQATTDDLTDLFGQESRVVYPGISPHSATSLNTSPKHIVKQETSADLDQIIFTPGRTDFIGKGLDVLLKAYAMLLQQEANLPPLVLVGPPGEGHERLQAELKRPELRGKVFWLGRVSNDCVDALYAMSKFVVFASRYEGFGFPVLEAMQHNAPLICSSAGSLAEVAGDAAYVVPPDDLHALAIAMQQLNRDDTLRQTLVAKGKQRIGFFNWNATYEGMFRAFFDTIPRQIRR